MRERVSKELENNSGVRDISFDTSQVAQWGNGLLSFEWFFQGKVTKCVFFSGGVSNAFHYQITLRIIQFDPVPGETVILDAHWFILERKGRRILLEKGSQIRIPFLGKGYDDIVSA